ncbi:MAG: hypothetical protein LUE92_17105 [Clostridiales bacterium]|nr:hypothetical protein [Clostridiales bacterium]
MSEKRKGRPTDDPKTVTKRARVSEEDARKLKICSERLNKSESDILRMGIDIIYRQIMEVKR